MKYSFCLTHAYKYSYVPQFHNENGPFGAREAGHRASTLACTWSVQVRSPTSLMVSQSPAEVIPECRVRSYSWAPPGMAPKENKRRNSLLKKRESGPLSLCSVHTRLLSHTPQSLLLSPALASPLQRKKSSCLAMTFQAGY